ncbi:MAG: hypothetical protein IJW55_03270 [Clostridia bacterium]|nr:hypothetical protein [Clostridia bacterium]
MTLHTASAKQKNKPVRSLTLTPGQVTFGLFALFCLFLILRNSDIAIEYMSRGLLLCARTVIPSLFPFMVLSELIVSGGIGNALLKKLAAPLRRLFGLPDAGCCAVVLGMLCGFPVGAKCAILAYEQGNLTKEETERVLTFSNNPSSAFLISAVGVSLWGNRRFGIALYATVLTVSVLTGILTNLLRKKSDSESLLTTEGFPAKPPLTGPKLFTEAVKSATGSILLVCAYVIFFSALVGTLNLVLGSFDLPQNLSALLFCLFELSSGVSQASALGNTTIAAWLCAFAAGWSGLSVHCQVLSVCDGKELSFRSYFIAKVFQGIACALLFGIFIYFFPEILIPAEVCGK